MLTARAVGRVRSFAAPFVRRARPAARVQAGAVSGSRNGSQVAVHDQGAMGKRGREEATEAYEAFCTRMRRINALDGVDAIISWDELVMMPEGASEMRGQQKAALAEVRHKEATCAEYREALERAERSGVAESDRWAAANLRLARKAFDQASRLPVELKAREAVLGARGYDAWHKARADDNWEGFAPVLGELVDLRKEIAGVCADPGVAPYDYLIDSQFERGMSEARVAEIFAVLREKLAPVIRKVLSAEPLELHPALEKGTFPEAAQEKFCRVVAEKMGYDFGMGRLDRSVHPFTGGVGPVDVRITTRYSEGNMMDAVMGTVHEVGHALYEQGLDKEQALLDAGQALSMGIHESQSLFWERYVGQSEGFWQALLPEFHNCFPHAKGCTARDVYRYVNKAKAGLIRVDADELTYSMHVVLRFELERALFSGDLAVRDLPSAWKAKMEELLGVVPPNDTLGVLQDVHWSDGSFGYFPSYTLGAMYACQFYQQAREELGDVEGMVAKGDLKPLREWLRAKIHSQGSLHASADELCEAVTGKPLDPQVYVDYLNTKYSALYGVPL
mmetsp:Transcript_13297/g.46001  ORF Transcript_13297/g.46001 Transcript_13297/m.46001 type:complete len:562 (+) Transcript_13297:30-1715(+)